ncbi:MAG: hypothetical protein QF363_18110 [Planctomycetaceae bacterium]|nr:hypothetical protein [Planctomycetaceae bacterium]
MSRCDRVWLVIGMLLVAFPGCSHLVESRSIARFTSALEKKDLSALREASTPGFRSKALRNPSAVEAMKLLELPEGEVTVADVEETSENKRRVVVEVGADARRLTYELIRDRDTGQWLVDDLLLKQSRRGASVTRSTTDLMDLLLSVHEFQSAWKSGDRQRLLDSTTGGFSKLLADLPAPFLIRISQRVVVPDAQTFRSQPRASLDKGTAQVRYDGPEGKTVLALIREKNHWRVDDIVLSAESQGKRPESIRHLAAVVRTTVEFLDAYKWLDRKKIKEVAAPRFFQNSLAHADLTEIPLPDSSNIDATAEVRLQQTFSDVILKVPDGLVRVSLERERTDDPTDTSVGRFGVTEVTLIEYESDQERRLSAVYTAHARMRLFSAALRRRDLAALKHNSSHDLNNRVWKHLEQDVLNGLPLMGIDDDSPRVSGTVFQGAVTEITATQGRSAITYVLREQGGVLLVDDILVPVRGRSGSLKHQLERLVPVSGFAGALSSGNVSKVTRHVSSDFNRLVFKQLDQLPRQATIVPRYLKLNVSRMQQRKDQREEVLLGDDQFGARVVLVSESGRFVVDDVELLAGGDPSQPTWLKQTLRLEVARPRNIPRVKNKPVIPRDTRFPTPPDRTDGSAGSKER